MTTLERERKWRQYLQTGTWKGSGETWCLLGRDVGVEGRVLFKTRNITASLHGDETGQVEMGNQVMRERGACGRGWHLECREGIGLERRRDTSAILA